MFREVVILASSAAASYAWLCAIASPLARTVQALRSRGRDVRAWRACALASGGAVLWTLVGAGGTLLFMMTEPRVGLALLRSPAWLPGLCVGTIVWALQLMSTDRIPRIGDDFEVATALAITALAKDDPETLARVEALYRAHALVPAKASGRVYGLAT